MTSWAPHIFKRRAEGKGCSKELIDSLVAEGNRLKACGLPVVFTMNHLSELTGTPYQFLERIVSRKCDPYRVFNLRKRGVKPKYRQIAVPDPHLAKLQRWIHQEILFNQTVHPGSTAYSYGCNPVNNASIHAGAKWLVKMDITDFFEATSERQVYKVFRSLGFRALLAFQFSRLCTRLSHHSLKYSKKRWTTKQKRWPNKNVHIGHLPQGAPTSPMLANLVCRDLDFSLHSLAELHDCAYSRYADDIVFSSNSLNRQTASKVISKSSELLGGMGFTRNRRKTQVCPPGARKIVTGLLVDHDVPRLSGDFRSKIDLHLYHAKRWGVANHCERRGFRSLVGFRAHLHGLITYAEHVESEYGAECRVKFNNLDWSALEDFPLFT